MKLLNIVLFILIFLQGSLFSQTILYHEDFEDSTSDWWSTVENFEKILDGNNHILKGTGYANMDVGENWDDYRFIIHVKKLNGGMNLKFRLGTGGRYALGVYADRLYLVRTVWPEDIHTDLTFADVSFTYNQWHIFKIELVGSNIKIFLDNELYITYAADRFF